MYKVYYLVSSSTKWYYIGITKNNLTVRLTQHKSSANRGTNSPLYDCMRKYNNFTIILRDEYTIHKECCDREIELIAKAKELDHNILNLAKGGEGGFVVPKGKIGAWKTKLVAKRAGRKPALGMQHTKENKQLFSQVSKKYWETQKTYDSKQIASLSFKEAKEKYGISKTHYYRLKKRLLNNDQ